MDELENHTQTYTAEIEDLKEENMILQSHLEDQENRDCRPNLRVRGISETALNLQATMIALF